MSTLSHYLSFKKKEIMEDKKKFASLIVNYLKTELQSGNFNEEKLESLEVSIQCIESAYSLNPAATNNMSIKLEDIVNDFWKARGQQQLPSQQYQETMSASESMMSSSCIKEEAEYHKNCGNEFMKNQNNEKAIEAYSKSIKLNPNNPIFYCNRAAAFNAIGQYNDAIKDCQKAIELDGNYGKAYCRLGLAFTYLKDYHKAVSCYKKACELEPENVGYQRNYQLTVNNLRSNPAYNQEAQGGPHNIMETAARLMSDPDVSSVLNNILGETSTVSNNHGLDRLMQVGQTIVTRLQTANPNLLDGIRMHFESAEHEEESPESPPQRNVFPDDP